MLIRFKVANFLSFKEETEFSMVAGRERLHPNHVVKGEKNQPNLLRAALLYGANAAGKSNFVRAIDYAKSIIGSIPLSSENSGRGWYREFLLSEDIFTSSKKFRFDKEFNNLPSSFTFEFLSNNRIFQYGFKINEKIIIDEWLIDLSQTPEILFQRKYDKNLTATFYKEKFLDEKSEKEFLNFVKKSVTPDKLFLTHSIENNVKYFRDAFNWFRDSLRIIFPDTKDYIVGKKLNNNSAFKKYFISVMERSGTGITSIELKPNKKPNLLTKVEKNLFSNDFVDVKFIHNGIAKFTEFEESEGTQRLFDLAFPFYDLATSETPKVYIIDELERSLHTNLSYMLLKNYLEQTGKGQLIATTHDTHLLDLDLLRRDEIWFAEKDEHGATQLYSLYEFNPRYDKKIEKEYLTGRFGAIPFLGNLEFKKQLGKNGKSKK